MATSSHPNSSSSMPYLPKVVLNPTPISFAPPRTDASAMGSRNPIPSVPVGETDSAKKPKKGKKSKSNEESPAVSTESKKAKKMKSNEETPESKKAKKMKLNEESPSVSSEFKRPDWLPEAWEIKEHIREGGKSAGSKDKYYIEPGTNKRFRSLVEVRRHLGLDDLPMTNGKNNSPKAKSSEVTSNNKKESKKRKEENKKSRGEHGKIIAEQSEEKPEEVNRKD